MNTQFHDQAQKSLEHPEEVASMEKPDFEVISVKGCLSSSDPHAMAPEQD